MERRRKYELRTLNARAWAGEKDVFKTIGSLDSSLKKNTAFIKRLRTAITQPTLTTFLQDIRTLSLHKYLSEIISAAYEGLCKLKSPADVSAGVEVISALHQRFGPVEFTCYLGWLLGRGLATPEKAHLRTLAAEAREKEEKERVGRQRLLLRVVTELWLVGALRSLEDVKSPDESIRGKEQTGTAVNKAGDVIGRLKTSANGVRNESLQDAEPFPLEVLKDLLAHDREHVNLPLVVLFVKTFAWEILGAEPTGTEGRKVVEEDGAISTAPEHRNGETQGMADNTVDDGLTLLDADMQQRFHNILVRYFEDLKTHLIRDQKTLAHQARRNAEAYVRSGEIFEDRQTSYEKQAKAHEKFAGNAQVLSEALGVEMPDLSVVDDSAGAADAGIGLVKTGEYLRGQGEGAGIWEDEDERRFYENIIDVKDRVPGILLEDGKKKTSETPEQSTKKLDGQKDDGTPAARPESDANSADAKGPDPEDQSTAIANKTVGAQVDALLARLPELTSKDAIDQAAVDFCFLNSKASRNRLIKAVQDVPKGRSDLLPHYARLIATLGKYMPDVVSGLVGHLDAEFRSLQRRKDKDFLGNVRTSNIRYLAELTKFGIVPEHVIFHCLKVSLDEFSRMNISIIGNLLENCGRYLLRNPETAPRMTSFLETLQRKKSAQHLGQQERMLIENAVYYVDPPARAAIQQKEKTSLQLFVEKLVYLDMNKRSYTKVLKQIRKLHWEEEQVVHVLAKVFSKPGKVKHSNIHLLAVLIGALYRYHQTFVISVIDDVLEQVTVGLEQNDFRFNQRRISEIKYLGELYNYKMIDSVVVFDTLYRIVTFAHEGGTPKPGRVCALDMPDDYFRIRLVCTMLETCGVCFDRGAARKKLDLFLTFFQYYIFTKDPLPMDVEFLVQDTYSLTRPQWKLAPDLEEASRLFAEAVSQNFKSLEAEKAAEVEDTDEEESSDAAVEDDEDRLRNEEESQSEDEDEVLNSPEGEPQLVGSESENEDIVVTRQMEEHDPEADADFDRELAKLMTESLESRKRDPKQLFDVPLPMKRQQRELGSNADESGSRDTSPAPTGKVAFSLLTKRGNRQQTRTVELPSDSNFAVAMRTQKQAEWEEQQRIKNLVLNYDMRDDEPDGSDLQQVVQTWPTTKTIKGSDKVNAPSTKTDKPGTARNKQRSRKLQLSDVDWT